MTKIFGEEAEIRTRGVQPSISPPRRAGSVPSGADATVSILGAVGDLLSLIPKKDKLSSIGKSLDKRLRDIEVDNSLNTFQRADMKAKAINSAKIRGGKDGRVFLDDIAKGATTTREVSPLTGQIQLVNQGTGEVVGIERDTMAGVQAETIIESSTVLEEFFPSFSAVVGTVLTKQIAENADAVGGNALTPPMLRLREVSEDLDRVSRNIAVGITSEQQNVVIQNSERSYYGAATKLMNTFYDDVFVRSVQQGGGTTPEEMMELVNAAEKDFLDEVVGSGIPVDIAGIRNYTQQIKNDMRGFYTRTADKEISALNREKELLQTRNEITQEAFLNKNPDIIRLTQLKDIMEIGVFMATTTQQLKLQRGQTAPGQPTDNLNRLIKGSTQASENTMNAFQTAIGYIDTASNRLNRLTRDSVNIKDVEGLSFFMEDLQDLLSSDNSYSINEEIGLFRVNVLDPQLEKSKEQELITSDQIDRWNRQLDSYNNKSESIITGSGFTTGEFKQKLDKARGQLDSLLGRTATGILFGKGRLEKQERTQGGKLKEIPEESGETVNEE